MSSTTVKSIDITPSWSDLGSVFELVATRGEPEGFAMVVEELSQITDRAEEIASALRTAGESQMAGDLGGDLEEARADLHEVLVAADKRNNAARAARN